MSGAEGLAQALRGSPFRGEQAEQGIGAGL